MNSVKGKQSKRPLRFLAALLSLVLTVTLFPSEMMAVRAEGTTLVTDGGAVTWDFRDQSAAIYSGADGSLRVEGEISYNGGQHGANIGNGTVFTLSVPAGQTTVTFGVCAYGSSSAKITAGGTVLEESFSLNGAASDGQEYDIQYTSESAATITIEVSGNGYLHSITADTITPPQLATVSGTVTSASENSVDGQTLVFTDESQGTTETEIENGSYSVSLPVGHSYTVSFENSDIYEVTGDAGIDLTDASNGDSVIKDISYCVIWDISKVFSFEINGTTYTVTPGSSSSEDFSVTAKGGDGSVELATTDTAIIWADLESGGRGTLTSDMIGNISGDVQPAIEGNTVTFTYSDTTTSPAAYTVQVKDNSASGTPRADGETRTYDLGDGSIVSGLYTGDYSISDGDSVRSTDGIVTVTGNNRIRYNGSHGIMIGNGDQISVNVAGNAKIGLELCSYSAEESTITATADGEGTLDPGSVSAVAETDGDTVRFTYTGDAAATLTFTYNGSGSGYLHSIDVTNELPETEINEQTEMPEVKGDTGNLTEEEVGQRLTLGNEKGSLPSGAGVELSDSAGYYGFDLTDAMNRLEADVVVNSCGNSSSNGVFFGAFNGTAIETIGIRNSTNLRGIYSNEDSEVRAGRLDETIEEGQIVHFTAEKTDDGFVITATPSGGETYTMESSDSDALFAGGAADAEISFGFILADAEVTVTNMKYYDADGDLLYDQNDCYEPIGDKPVVTSVQATAADTRDAIVISWTSSTEAWGDGRYVIQVSKDGGDWEDVAETMDVSYTYPVEEAGTYEFRVGGKLGSEGEVTYCDTTATVEDFLPALTTPAVTLTAGADAIDVSWTASEGATDYAVYRYSADEGEAGVQVVHTKQSTEALSWTDTTVTPEVPYYYYVIAYQHEDSAEINSSNPSETVWSMASAGHTGDYVYEDEAAVITVTDCPEGTVFHNTVSIGGTVDRTGTIHVNVNGTQAAQQEIASADGAFAFELRVSQGRNEIELLFTDGNGNVTRQTYNVVYLTNYDMVVDASYTGEDGAEVNGIPTYSTVQAAVNAVPADNTERQVIYIRSGDYEERLVVESPYISLIGEDQDGVRIHCYPADLYPGDSRYEAGGDMSMRCATYVTSSAVGFSAENLTFANDYVYGTPDGKSNKSADALRCDADGASFVNVTISGVQDTLYMDAGNQYYYQCRIEGLIDFIYSGDDARALFEDCELVIVYEETHPEGGYVCAPRTAADAPYGLIFKDCSITSEEGCADGSFCLARPWGADASICWINCYMGSAINADAPYADMSGNSYQEANFYEYGSYGPGYAVNADRRQLSPTQVKTLFANLGWDPAALLQATGSSYNGNIEEPEPEEPTQDPPSGDPEGGAEQKPGAAGGNDASSGNQAAGAGGQNAGVHSGENNTAAATGDTANVTVWAVLLTLAGAASAVLFAVRKKEIKK